MNNRKTTKDKLSVRPSCREPNGYFKKEIATHSIGAKAWTLLLFATLIDIILRCQSIILFNICFWIGIIIRLEIIAIILISKKWANDVPSFFHAIKLRQNKEIKRHKMFNG